MRFLLPLALLVSGLLPARHLDRIEVPGAPVSMLASGKFKEDPDYHLDSPRKDAAMKSIRSYLADEEESLTLAATVTEFGKLKLNRDRLRVSFAMTVWDYETDDTDKQDILEEKETTFGDSPAFYMKMRVKPSEGDPYLFEAYSIGVDNKEVFVSASYFDDDDSKKALKDWTDSIEVNGKKRGELQEIAD